MVTTKEAASCHAWLAIALVTLVPERVRVILWLEYTYSPMRPTGPT